VPETLKNLSMARASVEVCWLFPFLQWCVSRVVGGRLPGVSESSTNSHRVQMVAESVAPALDGFDVLYLFVETCLNTQGLMNEDNDMVE
jgi:hypothetical protein